jgi:Ca2+-binding EF-hand superfamily protein
MGNKQGKGGKGGKGGSTASTSGTTSTGKTTGKAISPEVQSKYGTVDPAVVAKLQEQTGFDKVEVNELYNIFQKLSPSCGGKFDKATFRKALQELGKVGLKSADDTPFADRLFSLLDTNGDGSLDLTEFVTGLSMLCKGSVEDKLALSFKAYDIDGNGFITKDELALMFKQAWMAGYSALCMAHGTEQMSNADLQEFSEEMATLFAENAFESLDTNGDGKLSFQEFKEFAMAEPKITATLNGFKQEVNITFA